MIFKSYFTISLILAVRERQIALHKVLLVATNTFCYIGKPIVTNVVVYAIVEEQVHLFLFVSFLQI